MTVGEAIAWLKDPQEIDLSWFADIISFNFKNDFELSVYANYEIQSIIAAGEGKFELVLAAEPRIRKEAAS